MKRRPFFVALALASVAARSAAAAPQSFVNFESGHVRPLAIAGDLLFAVDTPDNRLAIYVLDGLPQAAPIRLKRAAEIAVGLEPVAVAASQVNCLGNGICTFDVWVVNHLSDDVTAIRLNFDTTKKTVHLVRLDTLPTCDEPRDIVLAGKYTATQAPARAFVTTARRGQNCPLDAKLGVPGVPRGVVQVFNLQTHALDGAVELFSDTPRGLAVSRDGQRVYAAAFLSGNRTATVPESAVSANGGLPPPPPMSTALPPSTGLIVQFNPADGYWEENGLRPPATTPKDWSAFIAFSLPDYDVFAIDANAAMPSAAREISGVGTVLFNLAVRPAPKTVTGVPGVQHRDEIFVSNTEALNPVRFETVLRDHFVDNRISVIRDWKNPHLYPPPPGGPFGGWQFDVSPVPLNAITYSCLPPGCTTSTADLDDVLALPTEMVFTTNGKKLFVAAFGSGAVGIFAADQLSQGNPSPRQVLHVGGGPSGLALDPVHDRLYVMDRFSNSIVVVKQASTAPAVVGNVALYDPSPDVVKKGRHTLYDARNTSGHGDVACASCHAFGDFDGLAWDLGNPTLPPAANCNPFFVGSGVNFHPMKGPMTTQSLRGLPGAGPMHWRGDRSGCGPQPNTPPDLGSYNVPAGFKKFNGAFVSLLGRASQLDTTPGGELDQFTDFALSVHYPPNPIRPFDGFSADAQLGQTFFLQQGIDLGLIRCNDCHAVPLGTSALSSTDLEPQQFKIPHLRNLYQKVGMFGIASGQSLGFPLTGPTGDQVRGFGYLHDGSVDTLLSFLHSNAFQFTSDTDRQHVEQFLLEFDTGLAPIVGQQVTVTKTNGRNPSALITRADAGECDLVARGVPDPKSPRERGYWYHQEAGDPAPLFYGDTASSKFTPAALLALIQPAGYLTYTCVPPGSGRRIGIDRDCDGVLDGDQTTAPNPITAYPTGLCP
jgi:DNA-binding beta-propeller fold protein YncE